MTRTLFFEKEKFKGSITPLVIMFLGASIVGINIFAYQSFLPQTITSENSSTIQQQGYAFYIILIGGKIVVLLGIRKLYYKIKFAKKYDETMRNESSSQSSPPKPSLISIIVNVISYKNSLRIFLPVVAAYGLFYSIVSSMLIFRAEGFHHTTGATAPYAMIMTHGPIGYAPSIALGITDNIGLLVIPINLVILTVVSSLVGLNAVLSIYAFMHRPREHKMVGANKTHRSINGSQFMAGVGASSAIFAVCPTCASLYIFGMLTGSFASTITAFGVAFYGLFAAISIPILLVSPFVTALSIRRIIASTNFCSPKK